MIDPGVQSAMVGVVALGIAYLGKVSICYLKLKLNKNEKVNNCKSVCSQHAHLVAMVKKISDHYEDEKQIDLYSKAIERVNSGK